MKGFVTGTVRDVRVLLGYGDQYEAQQDENHRDVTRKVDPEKTNEKSVISKDGKKIINYLGKHKCSFIGRFKFSVDRINATIRRATQTRSKFFESIVGQQIQVFSIAAKSRGGMRFCCKDS